MANRIRTPEQKAARRASDQRNKGKREAGRKAWNAANADHVRVTAQARRASLKGRARTMAQNAQTRARARGEACDVTTENLLPLLETALELRLVTCESERPDTASLDRIDSQIGYLLSNVQVVPWWYNAAKHDFTAASLIEAMGRWRLVYG